MRFCKKCGSVAAKNDEFCVICGAKIDEETEKSAEDDSETIIEGNSTDSQDIEKESEAEQTVKADNSDIQNEIENDKLQKEDDIQTDFPKKEAKEINKNANIHDEFVDISSFASDSSKQASENDVEQADVEEAKDKPVVAPKKKSSETKVVNSISDIESKTREISSVSTEKKAVDSKRKISKGMRAAIIVCCSVAVIAVGIVATIFIAGNKGPTAEELFASGQEKYNSEDFYGAINDLSECVKIDTSDVDAYMLLADAYIKTGKEDEAVSALQIGYRETGSTKIKTRLDDLSEKLRVEKVYNSLINEGNSAVKNKDYNLAATKYVSAIEAKPNIAEPYLLAADAYVNLEEYQKAIDLLETGLDKVEGDELSNKISEINATVKKIEDEEKKRIEEERKKAEEEQKEKERLEQERLDKLAKEPVKYDIKVDEKNLDYKNTNIFRSEARWAEITDDRDLPGIEYAKKLINQTLDSYYEFDKDLFGVSDEKELYNLVKASRNTAALSHCRITITYNRDGILSFAIYKYYMPPTILNYKETIETHTINLKTGEEYDLNQFIYTNDVDTLVKAQAELIGLSLTDEQIKSKKFFLSGDSLVFWIKKTDWEYEEIPLPYSDTDKFVMKLEEDTETTYLNLQ